MYSLLFSREGAGKGKTQPLPRPIMCDLACLAFVQAGTPIPSTCKGGGCAAHHKAKGTGRAVGHGLHGLARPLANAGENGVSAHST